MLLVPSSPVRLSVDPSSAPSRHQGDDMAACLVCRRPTDYRNTNSESSYRRIQYSVYIMIYLKPHVCHVDNTCILFHTETKNVCLHMCLHFSHYPFTDTELHPKHKDVNCDLCSQY